MKPHLKKGPYCWYCYITEPICIGKGKTPMEADMDMWHRFLFMSSMEIAPTLGPMVRVEETLQ